MSEETKNEGNKEDFKIESRGANPFLQMEIGFMGAFDALHRGGVPLEEIPIMCIEGFCEGDDAKRVGISLFAHYFFKKWKAKNGL